MDIQVTEKERAQNLVFQVKQLILTMSQQFKPQVEQAITLISNPSEGLSVDAIDEAMGTEKQKIYTKLMAIKDNL